MKFLTYQSPLQTQSCHLDAWKTILECEGRTLHIADKTPENFKKCMKYNKGSGGPVLVGIVGDYEFLIGTHYSHLVKYLNEEGLMLC